ncbi:MAG TPA: SRPBCC domain-containing protein, partial [Symbiobacteriaceae bacterium]|nr:SRPBCC domain-containing protein [Symbiobacteriaceae bacterium]
ADVWWALHDPGVLLRAIPYCKELIRTGPNEYQIRCETSILGFSIKVDGKASFANEVPPSRTTLLIAGGTPPKGFRINAPLALEDDGQGGTLVRWSLVGEGSDSVSGTTKAMVEQFIKTIERAAAARPRKD